MKPCKFLTTILVAASSATIINAQTTYVDVVTPVILSTYGGQIESMQASQKKQMTALETAKAAVAGQLAWANDLQNKVYKGLSEVSGTLSNGLQVKNILNNISNCSITLNNIWTLSKQDPKFTIFALKGSEFLVQESLKITSEISDIVAGGNLNLATAGDRRLLLQKIEESTSKLYIMLLTIQVNMENAKYRGFWKSLNPFQRYVDIDKAIYQDILLKWKIIKM